MHFPHQENFADYSVRLLPQTSIIFSYNHCMEVVCFHNQLAHGAWQTLLGIEGT